MAGQMKNTLVEYMQKVLREISGAMTAMDADEQDIAMLAELQGTVIGIIQQSQLPANMRGGMGGGMGEGGDPMAGGGPATPGGMGGAMAPAEAAMLGGGGGGDLASMLMGEADGGMSPVGPPPPGMAGQPPDMDELRRMMG